MSSSPWGELELGVGSKESSDRAPHVGRLQKKIGSGCSVLAGPVTGSMSQLTATHIKKRKQASKGEQATKRHKKDRKTKETDFEVVNASLVVAIPPIFARDPRAGVEEMLDSMVMRCVIIRQVTPSA